MLAKLCLACCCVLLALAIAPPSSSSSSSSSAASSNYVTVLRGSRKHRVLITAPHGGSLKPRGMPARSKRGCRIRGGRCGWGSVCRGRRSSSSCRAVLTQDRNTLQIAQQIRAHLLSKFGIRAGLVLMRVHRSRIDANRVGSEACQGRAKCRRVYRAYHAAIRSQLASWARSSRRGGSRGGSRAALLIDVHGQAHPQDWIELGYAIGKRQLNRSERGRLSSRLSNSIESLQRRLAKSLTLLVRGKHSMGGIMQRLGYRAVPSPRFKAPRTAKYFKGGPTIQMYGMARRRDCVDAIQFELPASLRNGSGRARKRHSRKLAAAIHKFYTRYTYRRGRCPA